MVIPEVSPSLGGSVVLFLKFTCTDTARLWANGSATCGLCWGPCRHLQKQGNHRVSLKAIQPFSSCVPLCVSPYPGVGSLCSYTPPLCLRSLGPCATFPRQGGWMEQAFLWVWHAQLRQEGTSASGKPRTFVTCSKAKSVAQNSLWKYFNYPWLIWQSMNLR